MNSVNKSWHVIYTAPRAEKKVNECLLNQGIETYLPLQKVLRQWSDRKKKVSVPLFNSYVFVNIDRDEYQKIWQVPGFSHFIYYLGKPAVVRQTEIENIRKFLAKKLTSEIRFETSNKAEILDGPLFGKRGIIESIGKNTIKINIEQLGINLTAEVQKSSVRQLNNA
jgi:transcription antitermination factor NusG